MGFSSVDKVHWCSCWSCSQYLVEPLKVAECLPPSSTVPKIEHWSVHSSGRRTAVVLETSCRLRAAAKALIFANVQPVISRAAAINRLPSGMSCWYDCECHVYSWPWWHAILNPIIDPLLIFSLRTAGLPHCLQKLCSSANFSSNTIYLESSPETDSSSSPLVDACNLRLMQALCWDCVFFQMFSFTQAQQWIWHTAYVLCWRLGCSARMATHAGSIRSIAALTLRLCIWTPWYFKQALAPSEPTAVPVTLCQCSRSA